MELLSFFLDNITEKDPYYQFKEKIETGWFDILDNQYIDYDKLYVVHPKEAISKFKELCQPAPNYSDESNVQFILICFYLYKENYYIEQFPDFLFIPQNLSEFAYGQIRTYLIENWGEDSGRVTWQARRKLIKQLKFKISENYYLRNELNDTFRIISTRGAEFHMMTGEEKLKEIANMLEFVLKDKRKFLSLDTGNLYFNFITNDNIKLYRKKIQCFRHSSKESLEERRELLPKIDFLISYGLAILSSLTKQLK